MSEQPNKELREAVAEAVGRKVGHYWCPTCKINIPRHDPCISSGGYHMGDHGSGSCHQFAQAEVERLRAGIREHRVAIEREYQTTKDTAAHHKLWSLLDGAGEDS